MKRNNSKMEHKRRARAVFDSESLMVIATSSKESMPRASTMLFFVDRNFHIYFATHADSHKTIQLQKNADIGGAIWKLDDVYVQWEGTAKQVSDAKKAVAIAERLAQKAVAIKKFWPPIFTFFGEDYAIFEVIPTWMRVLDLSKKHIRDAKPQGEVIIGE